MIKIDGLLGDFALDLTLIGRANRIESTKYEHSIQLIENGSINCCRACPPVFRAKASSQNSYPKYA